MARRRRIEIAIAWGSMVTLVTSTVAAVWITAGAVAGLVVLGLYAAVTGWHAQRGTLITWDEFPAGDEGGTGR